MPGGLYANMPTSLWVVSMRIQHHTSSQAHRLPSLRIKQHAACVAVAVKCSGIVTKRLCIAAHSTAASCALLLRKPACRLGCNFMVVGGRAFSIRRLLDVLLLLLLEASGACRCAC
jgi:hypothetical protein